MAGRLLKRYAIYEFRESAGALIEYAAALEIDLAFLNSNARRTMHGTMLGSRFGHRTILSRQYPSHSGTRA